MCGSVKKPGDRLKKIKKLCNFKIFYVNIVYFFAMIFSKRLQKVIECNIIIT
ncbi:hypothetical protein THA_1953 [Thermosipho africanus TCF52B]|uniref:Uncharacterized protein n=1 Tax=Thermosipho africanus (strain TCF52B) TaxID=484019 RepID=B7IEE8_THEAB|nr:hypothetical protein THA_1953 [Thermosipho africanus TCF52B]